MQSYFRAHPKGLKVMNAEEQILKDAIDDASCPSFEDLCSALDGSAAAPKKTEILLHLKNCVRCQVEADLAEEFHSGAVLPQEKEDVEWIEAKLEESGFGMAARPRSRLLRFPRLFSGSGSWKPWAAIAAMALVAVAALQWPSSRPDLPGPAPPSGIVRSQVIELTQPVGLQPQPPMEWSWQAVEGASLYRVRFMEVDGRELLALQTEKTTVATPAPVAEVLRPGKRILWQVTALDGAGANLGSSPPQPVWLEVSTPRPQ